MEVGEYWVRREEGWRGGGRRERCVRRGRERSCWREGGIEVE